MASDDLEINCHLTPIHTVEPGDESARCRMFSLEVSASFLPPIAESDIEEYESDLFDAECDVIRETFSIEQERLLSEESSADTVREILTNMNVPIQSILVDRILEFVREIGRDKEYSDRKVVHIMVSIEVPMALYNGGVIERLEEISVEESGNCAICLEEMEIGKEARRMPNCEHLYHTDCILNWLEKGRCCPLCRSQIY